MAVYIKYSNDNWATETKISFAYPILDREIPSVSREKGISLRGVNYSHKLYSKTKRKIILSSLDLTDYTDKANIRAIWKAGALKYSNDDSTYYDVVLDQDGDYNPDFIEDDELFEEFEMNLTYKEPD